MENATIELNRLVPYFRKQKSFRQLFWLPAKALRAPSWFSHRRPPKLNLLSVTILKKLSTILFSSFFTDISPSRARSIVEDEKARPKRRGSRECWRFFFCVRVISNEAGTALHSYTTAPAVAFRRRLREMGDGAEGRHGERERAACHLRSTITSLREANVIVGLKLNVQYRKGLIVR